MDLDPAPVDNVRVLPAEIRIEIPLPDSAIGQILAPNDMGRPEQMVLHSRLEVEQRPDTILCPHEGVRGRDNAKSRPVAYGRVFVVHVGLDPQDGFALAEADLRLRGPGEFFGTRQSGLPDLRMAKISDVAILEMARTEAVKLFREDPGLEKTEHISLAGELARVWAGAAEWS